MSGRTRSARGLVLAAPSRAPHANRADRALPRRSESADEDNPQEISPGRGATRGDRGRCEAQHSELARLDACTYLVATARARRAVRRPRRDATEGLSAALDSEMAAMTGKAVEWPGAENDWGDAGVSRERARLEARRDEMRRVKARPARDAPRKSTEPNERTRREERPLARGGVLARGAGRRRAPPKRRPSADCEDLFLRLVTLSRNAR